MNAPKVRDESSVTTKKRKRQVVQTENSVGLRILERLGDHDYAWLSDRSGVPRNTISDCVQRGIARADTALKLADALEVSVDWLLRGTPSSPRATALLEVTNADWVEVPEYDLHQIVEDGKGGPISSTVFRRDWLFTALNDSSDLWIAKTVAAAPDLKLLEGTPLFCKDQKVGEPMIEGVHYFFRVNGGIILAKFTFRGAGLYTGEQVATPIDLESEENQHFVIAKVLGTVARRL